MQFRRREALRYLKAQQKDEAAGILVDTVYLKMRNEVQARHIVQRQHCTVDATGVNLSCGVRFNSTLLAKNLQDCEEVLLLGATLGARVDGCIRRLAVLSVAEGAAAQAVGAALIESYLDELQVKLQRELDQEGLYQKPRFSPGYGDWPLEEQKILFPVLDCARRIGLTLTEGCMMAPSKSVTAVIGLTREKLPCVQHKCSSCSNFSCEFRETDN